MANAPKPSELSVHNGQLSQLGETFLSSKHQDYLAAIAEFSSAERV